MILDFEGTGSLTVANPVDLTGSTSNITGNTADLHYANLSAAPIPRTLWRLSSGLAGLILLRKRTRKK